MLEGQGAHQIIALAASYADEDGHAVLYSQLHRLDGMVTQLEAELLAAQEREKALREAALQARKAILHGYPVSAEVTLWKALAATAGSPSEKPGSEEEA